MSDATRSCDRLPQRSDAPPSSLLGRIFLAGQALDRPHTGKKTHPWYRVLWLTGVDYFSTLGYQPGIALLAAGSLSVPATGILILVTLLGAVPVYAAVAGLSYAGLGSIALLESHFSGWKSKIVVLVLLGFASTDFVITMTISAADAARHASANPFLHGFLGGHHIVLTALLLLLLAVVFWMGFSEAIGLAIAVAIPYLVLNACVLVYGLKVIWANPSLLSGWRHSLHAGGDWTNVIVASIFIFPRLALGLSGFETGVSVMPLISDDKSDKKEKKEDTKPDGRIRATRKLLVAAAVIMCALLLLSSFVAAVLVPESAYRTGGEADGRVIAYLAHQFLGGIFGSLYDLSTILILWFAGASAMTGLLHLLPRYLPHFGMAPKWVAYRRPLVLILLAVNLLVTLAFRASVKAQGSAYATGVLVLMLSAAVAVALAYWHDRAQGARQRLLSIHFWIVSLVFAYTLIANIIERPAGIFIASIFILFLLLVSAASRYFRSTEMRVAELSFVDDESEKLWDSIKDHKVNLIPYHLRDAKAREDLAHKVEENFRIEGPLAFLHIDLMDNRSDFFSSLRLRVTKQGSRFLIEAHGAVAVANSIAYLTELLNPRAIVLGLTKRNLMRQSIAYALWGEGEIGITVYSILVRYWEFIGRKSGAPRIYLMSQ